MFGGVAAAARGVTRANGVLTSKIGRHQTRVQRGNQNRIEILRHAGASIITRIGKSSNRRRHRRRQHQNAAAKHLKHKRGCGIKYRHHLGAIGGVGAQNRSCATARRGINAITTYRRGAVSSRRRHACGAAIRRIKRAAVRCANRRNVGGCGQAALDAPKSKRLFGISAASNKRRGVAARKSAAAASPPQAWCIARNKSITRLDGAASEEAAAWRCAIDANGKNARQKRGNAAWRKRNRATASKSIGGGMLKSRLRGRHQRQNRKQTRRGVETRGIDAVTQRQRRGKMAMRWARIASAARCLTRYQAWREITWRATSAARVANSKTAAICVRRHQARMTACSARIGYHHAVAKCLGGGGDVYRRRVAMAINKRQWAKCLRAGCAHGIKISAIGKTRRMMANERHRR